ncbi:MAG: dephospho-CoA kinase [Blautia sp.]|nr:dephospho-CoA kinase [Blautia sp.]
MRKIGLTGGIGAGKSTVLSYLEERWGAYVIQADQVGHQVMAPGGACYEAVVALFGQKVVKSDKTIDRRQVSDVVFRVAEKREALNRIIHPAVRSFIQERLREQEEQGREICVVEAALLLEDHYERFLDEIWVVTADRETRIRRLMENRGYTREKCEEIISSQVSEETYRRASDLVIDNSSDLEQMKRQVDAAIGRKHK